MKIFARWPIGIAAAACLLAGAAVIGLGQEHGHPPLATWEYGRLVVNLGEKETSTWTQTNGDLIEDTLQNLGQSYRKQHPAAANVSNSDPEMDILSAVGASGWELVAVQARDNSRWFYFKRLSQPF
ncbi:MAG: hypothetical protein ACLQVA_00385 [Candidatus Brocadiia bacterium]